MAPGRRSSRDRSRGRSRGALAALVLAGSAVVLWPAAGEATVEEQRARLPPPAKCTDDVEGVWLAHDFWGRYNEWYIFTLTIRRASPGSNELKGEILSHYWDGGPKDQQPPGCGGPPQDRFVKMPAVGTVKDGDINFRGTSWREEPNPCGPGGRFANNGYNPDNFSGKIDPATQEFQSVNNDGGRAVNEPTVFRRVRCFDPAEQPRPTPIDVKPPAFEPPRRFGCGRS